MDGWISFSNMAAGVEKVDATIAVNQFHQIEVLIM